MPLVLLGLTGTATAESVVGLLRQEGMGVALALGDRACLRMAVALEPDVILLDPALPRGLLSLLRGHPLANRAHIAWSRALATPSVGNGAAAG